MISDAQSAEATTRNASEEAAMKLLDLANRSSQSIMKHKDHQKNSLQHHSRDQPDYQYSNTQRYDDHGGRGPNYGHHYKGEGEPNYSHQRTVERGPNYSHEHQDEIDPNYSHKHERGRRSNHSHQHVEERGPNHSNQHASTSCGKPDGRNFWNERQYDNQASAHPEPNYGGGYMR